MSLTTVYLNLPKLDRVKVREYLIQQFLLELPGTGKGDSCSKYLYVVEYPIDEGNIYIKRPASLNKGMDFTIHVQGHKFRPRGMVDMPSHDNIIDDLTRKKLSNPSLYQNVAALINQIYNCQHINPSNCNDLNITPNSLKDLTVTQVLMCIKWLFIEQDVTYWNWSGRNMFYTELRQKGLC